MQVLAAASWSYSNIRQVIGFGRVIPAVLTILVFKDFTFVITVALYGNSSTPRVPNGGGACWYHSIIYSHSFFDS